MNGIGRHVSRLSGYAPALPTPFDEDGAIDCAAFERLCALQVEAGATALVVAGTTGEASTLTPGEHWQLIRLATSVARGVPVIAGAGSNATCHAIELTKAAENAGADAVLSVVPYYNKPTQAGLLAHFTEVAKATGLPIIVYDIPSRSACGLADDTLVRLADNQQFIGLKDASGDITRPMRLKAKFGDDFRLLSGDDATAFAFISQGGHGCISVTSNVAPGLCRSMYLAYRQGRIAEAQRWACDVAAVTAALMRESNPAPLKFALHLLGLMRPSVRLPLVEPTEATRNEIAAVLMEMRECFADYTIGVGGRARRRCAAE